MSTISFEDFEKVDIRIGTVKKAEIPEWSHAVIKMTVDLGPSFAEASAGKRYLICFSSIMKFFKPEDLKGKQFLFVTNLEPKTIGPDKEFSEAMMIMAVEEDEAPVLFQLPKKVANGTKVR